MLVLWHLIGSGARSDRQPKTHLKPVRALLGTSDRLNRLPAGRESGKARINHGSILH
jgi:hypothetical protein